MEVFRFPVWWYTRGFEHILLFIWREITSLAIFLNLPILFRNLFAPMYGQTDWQGRLISFGVRSVQLFFLAIVTILWTVILACFAVLWVLFPLLVFDMILYQLGVTDNHLLFYLL